MDFSLIITSRNRTKHLKRALEGVERNAVQPKEIIIVSNDVTANDLDTSLPVQIINSPYKDFPIGKNRNLGAEKAQTDYLFFLDVDCIPESNYFETVAAQIQNQPGLWMGQPLYLSQPVSKNFTYNDIADDAIVHPHRPNVKTARKESNYAIFWSLCFAISKQDYIKSGGFDPNFKGYGAEDTDFAFQLEKVGVPFYLSEAKVYHQQHTVYRPPVNHLEDIVYNSNVFYQKWEKWPMGGWLQEFKDKGWIVWNEASDQSIEIIKMPNKQEVEQYRYSDARFV